MRRPTCARGLAMATLALLLFVALPVAAKVVERIAAVVNDEIILLSEVEEAAAAWRGMLAGIRDPQQRMTKQQEIYGQVLDMLIEERLLQQQIEELNIEVSQEDIDAAIARVMQQNNIPNITALRMALSRQGIEWSDYRAEVAKQLAKWRFIHAKFSARVKISDEEVQAAYRKEVEQAEPEYEYRARHILFRAAENAPEAEVEGQMNKAKEVMQKLAAGGDFADLAAQYSEGPTAKFGGDLGYFRTGVMVRSFEDAVLHMEVGQISDVVRSPFGLHIIQLTDRRPVPGRSFEQAEPELRTKLREEAMQNEMDAWLKQLRERAYVDIKLDQPPRTVGGQPQGE